MLFKILHGDKARISTDITPYHEGYCYVTHDGDFYVDMNNERVKLNAKDAETLTGKTLDEIKEYVTTQSDWNQTDSTKADFIKNKIPLKSGTGNGSVVIGEGNAAGSYSISGGSTNKDAISGIIGELASTSVSVSAPKSLGAGSLSLGAGTEAISAGSNAIGVMNVSGVKGYYWESVGTLTSELNSRWGFDADLIGKPYLVLSNSRTIVQTNYLAAGSFQEDIDANSLTIIDNNNDGKFDWKIGDTISLVNGSNKYAAVSTIRAIDTKEVSYTAKCGLSNKSDVTKTGTRVVIIVDSLPFSDRGSVTLTTPDDFTIFACYQKEEVNYLNKIVNKRWYPRPGIIELGWAGTTFGIENLTTGSGSIATGWNNWSAGDFGFTSGRDNISGYAAQATGSGTKATGDYSSAEGRLTEATGLAAHVEGMGSKAIGDYSHAGGVESEAHGPASSATNYKTRAVGQYAVATGAFSGALSEAATAFGRECIAGGEGAYDGTSKTWNITATETGKYSIAGGYKSKADGEGAIALGKNSTASGANSLAMVGGHATCEGAIAIGGKADELGAIAIGNSAFAGADSGIAINGGTMSGVAIAGHTESGVAIDGSASYDSIAIGGSVVEAYDAVAIGGRTSGDYSFVAMGTADADSRHAVVLKGSAVCSENSVVIGYDAKAGNSEEIDPLHATNSVAIGTNSQVMAEGAIAIGVDALATGARAVAINGSVNDEGENSIAINADVYGSYSVALHGISYGIKNFVANGISDSDYTVAINGVADADSDNSVVLGGDTHYSSGSVVIGHGASAGKGEGSDAIRATNSVAIGTNSQVMAEGAIALGGGHATGAHSIAIGGNFVTNEDGTETWKPNTASGESSFAFGQKVSAKGIGSAIFGKNYEVTVDNNGESTTTTTPHEVLGNYSFAAGRGCRVYGGGSVAFGFNHEIKPYYGAAVGHTNRIGDNGDFSFVSGKDNTVYSPYSFVGGYGNSIPQNCNSVFVAGKYANVTKDTAMAIGNGEAGNLGNIFHIDKTNKSITLGNTTITESKLKDLIDGTSMKDFVDTQIGNIAEALQAILDLQNSYLTPSESEWMEYDLDEDGGVTVSGLQSGTYQVKARNMSSSEYDIDADSTWTYNPDTTGEELILFWDGKESVAVIPQGYGTVRFLRNMPINGIALKKVG